MSQDAVIFLGTFMAQMKPQQNLENNLFFILLFFSAISADLKGIQLNNRDYLIGNRTY